VVVAAAMMLCLGLGSLWLSAGPAGPVLGPGLADPSSGGPGAQPERNAAGVARAGLFSESSAASNAANNAANNVENAAANSAQAQAAPGAEARSAVLAAEGLTLLPEAEGAQSAPAGLTLQPPRDQGPSLRSPIARGPAAVAPADESAQGGPRGLFRTVAFSMVGRQ